MTLVNSQEIVSRNLEFFQQQNNISLPYAFQIDSQLSGPHIMVVGATHGHELAGVEAIVQFVNWLKDSKCELEKGKLTLVIGNPEAYRQGIRFVDQNLNRAYSPEVVSNTEGKRVNQMRAFLTEQPVDFILDLHSVSIGDFKAMCYIINPRNTELAFKIGNLNTHYTFYEEHLPGMLIEEIENGIAVECGNNNLATTIDTAFDHIVNTVREYGLITKEKLPIQYQATHKPENIMVYESVEAIRPGNNFNWNIPVNELCTDYAVSKHQIFAIDDDGPKESPCEAVLLMPDANPKPGDADAGFLSVKRQVETTKVLDEITRMFQHKKNDSELNNGLNSPSKPQHVFLDKETICKFFNPNSDKLGYINQIGNPTKGKKVMIVGAIHGSEPAGLEASINLHRQLKPYEEQLNGQITFVLGDPEAFFEKTRLIDRNLNRSFINEPDLNFYEHRRAEEIKAYIRQEQVDFVLDLHCVSKGVLRCLIYTETTKNQIYLKEFKVIDRHLMFSPQQIQGSMIGFAEELGIDSLAVECGNEKDPESIEFAENVIWEVLIKTGVIDSNFDINLNLKTNKPKSCLYKYNFLEPIPVKSGFKFLNQEATTDTPVKAGEPYAISDEGYISSRYDGYLFFPDHSPDQNDSDAGFIVSRKQIES